MHIQLLTERLAATNVKCCGAGRHTSRLSVVVSQTDEKLQQRLVGQ
jgi:hypothetical protein